MQHTRATIVWTSKQKRGRVAPDGVHACLVSPPGHDGAPLQPRLAWHCRCGRIRRLRCI